MKTKVDTTIPNIIYFMSRWRFIYIIKAEIKP
jgi:hypothetical protein